MVAFRFEELIVEDDHMHITVTSGTDITRVTLEGRLDSASSIEVTDQIMPEIAQTQAIVLDMTAVKYMSSAGLRMLLQLHRAAEAAGRKLVLVGLAPMLTEVMDITGFLDFFTLYPTLDDGLSALQSS